MTTLALGCKGEATVTPYPYGVHMSIAAMPATKRAALTVIVAASS